MKGTLIALLTDFGLKDYFVAALKAVILTINPKAQIVDISHEVESFNRVEAAYLLKSVAPYFPKGTIFITIVDPGVGSSRKILLIKGKKHFFIGPDNGVLIPAAEEEGIIEIRQLEAKEYFLPSSSRTFEGRDKMAPVAGWLSRGLQPENFGPVASTWEKFSLPQPLYLAHEIRAEALHLDKFGNIITNIPYKNFLEWLKSQKAEEIFLVTRKKQRRLEFTSTFASGSAKLPLLIAGSSNYMEIAWKEDSAAHRLEIKPGDKIRIKIVKARRNKR
ncbi:MAG: SAM-dependent chlorinase/fluorinase [Candidatus Aminicenantes bacterium]|nr:SAM-dependent chlorinase/fluorinase [Candidatus Aminicenantes bacterium]